MKFVTWLSGCSGIEARAEASWTEGEFDYFISTKASVELNEKLASIDDSYTDEFELARWDAEYDALSKLIDYLLDRALVSGCEATGHLAVWLRDYPKPEMDEE